MASNHTRNWWIGLLTGGLLAHASARGSDDFVGVQDSPRSRVVIVHNSAATHAYEPQLAVVRQMVQCGLTNITGQSTVARAWLSLVSTQDTIGIKVYSAPGPLGGTRPAVVEALVETLLRAGIPPAHVVVWDRKRSDLQQAGFVALEQAYGIRVEGSVDAGYDNAVAYNPETPFLGPLVWSDLEFGDREKGAGRKSYVSKLVTQQLTKIINVSPLLNHYGAGVVGNLYSLSLGSVDNTQRFELNPSYLAQAVPEIYAMREIGDKAVLHVVDALICQYQGQHVGLLHYATALNELRFSKDPVALDLLSVQELTRQRRLANVAPSTGNKELFDNATLLQLGTDDPARIMVERFE